MTDVCILKVQITVAKVKTEGAPHKNEVRIRKKEKRTVEGMGWGNYTEEMRKQRQGRKQPTAALPHIVRTEKGREAKGVDTGWYGFLSS